MIFFRLSKYLRYIIMSRHRKGHAIHSPFVFGIIKNIFRNKIDTSIVSIVETTRKRMLSDRRSVEIVDLGAGADRKNSTLRRVSEMARKSPVPAKYGALLSNMAAEFGGCHIIELGTSLGISTMYLSAARPEAKVSTIEGCKQVAEIASENFRAAGLRNINVYTGSFDEVLPSLLEGENTPGLVFIDGNHRKDPVLKYFDLIIKKVDEKSAVIIDDINYSQEMASAWEQIRSHEKVSVSIDINRMGLLFFRKGMTHNDYQIRY
jgi:predicted O-methyltransferase YrrM